jgi:glyoxylate carboligase
MPPIILGPTGQFPRGKLNKDDEGELQLAVGIDDGVIKILFGKPVAWLALTVNDARAFAAVLNTKANDLEQIQKEETT